MEKQAEKKKMITTGIIRWWRYLLFVIAFFVTIDMIQHSSYGQYKMMSIFLMSVLIYVLWKRRRLKYDAEYLYIKRGNEETAVPLADIVSIKKSRTKINGYRFWILIYTDELKQSQTLRFHSDFDGPFHDAVRNKNPEVVIWTHPFFNH
jgi:hypothetical protein